MLFIQGETLMAHKSLEAAKEYRRQYRLKNAEKAKQYLIDNAARIAETRKARYYAKHEEVKAKKRDDYQKNEELYRARNRARYYKDREVKIASGELIPRRILDPQENKTRRLERSKNWQKYTLNGRSQQLLGNCRARARANGAKVTIGIAWIKARLEAGKCELTGIEFYFYTESDKATTSGFRHPFSPSIDRIDHQNYDYTPENCRVVLLQANIAINSFGLDSLLTIAHALVERNKHV